MGMSAVNRSEQLRRMEQEEWDLIVIGGGITGAGIALDAAVRGLRVALVEQADFGSGTSSRSTKLVHGGLRYLKQGEVKLVREVGRERAILYKNAPHLVEPVPMLLPIYRGGTYGYFASSIGLYLYDMLAGVIRKERRKMLSREQTLKQEPLLKANGLKGGGLYFEYRTDDARLTLELIKTAAARGASVINYTASERFLYEQGKVCGIQVTDRLSDQTYHIRGRCIVNAAGPWVDEVRKQDGSLQGKRLFHTKGVHLVVDAKRLPIRQAAYFDTPDGRMIFVIPRGDITYIGTTDTPYHEALDDPRMTKEDRDYLLRAVQDMFPSAAITEQDVISHWAGIRPLIYEEGKGPSELSRKDEILISPTGLITIAGGKLTGYRKMAEKVVDRVTASLHKQSDTPYPKCTTDLITISGGELESASSYEEWKTIMVHKAEEHQIPAAYMQKWIQTYGSNALVIAANYVDLPDTNGSEEEGQRALRAELLYSITEEMTATAADYLRLRTGWMYVHPAEAMRNQDAVHSIMSELLEWDQGRRYREAEQVRSLFEALHQLSPHE